MHCGGVLLAALVALAEGLTGQVVGVGSRTLTDPLVTFELGQGGEVVRNVAGTASSQTSAVVSKGGLPRCLVLAQLH